MAQLYKKIGRMPDQFEYGRCRLERKGFLSIFSYGLDDRDKRYDMMNRGDAVIVLPADFARRELYAVEQPRFIRAFKETADGNMALVEAMRQGEEKSFVVSTSAITTMEMPAGVIDEGETELQTAIRELFEETGIMLPSGAFEKIATYYTSVGGSNE